MANRLTILVSYEDHADGWAVDYNRKYSLVERGIELKEKAKGIARSEAQARANGEKEPVDVKIYKKNGMLQDTITKKPQI
jgi:hypothetical protein